MSRFGKISAETLRVCLELAATSPAPMSEKTFMGLLVNYAKRTGWLVYHPFDSRKSQAGFPDLTLVRERVMFCELKTDTGTLSPDQQTWLDTLTLAKAEVYVWRPKDWKLIEETLR